MREIKFRVFDKQLKTMHIVGEIQHDSLIIKNNQVIYYNLQNGESSEEFSDYVLMQFTGLEDKSGKKIYEGDILGAYDEKPLYVKWSEEHAAFVFVDYFDPFGTTILTTDDISYEAFEIIGNIYENPELLEGASE